jgi:flagellar hook-length control protein FliK
MQAVQLDTLLPQIQTQNSSPENLMTGDTSFMDMLRSKIEGIEREENEVSESQVETDEDNTQTASAKKSGQKTENGTEYEYMLNISENREKITQVNAKPDVNTAENVTVPDQEVLPPLTEKQLSWLRQGVNRAMSENEMSSEDFESMIEAAVEFIPGEISEEELLEKARNLALSDPEMFLEKTAEKTALNADVEISVKENPAFYKDFDLKPKDSELKGHKKDLKIQVTDLRTQKIDPSSSEIQVNKVQARKDYNLSYKRESAESFQVTMDLTGTVNQNITSSSAQAAGADGSVFQSMLASAVQENAGELIKAGNIVLKDNKQGSINLIVHPEKLGNVKISLNLSDKVISGSITVHSKEAYEAMKESIASLKNAFAESGFETGDFNLSFNDSGSQFAQNSEHHGNNGQAAFMAKSSYSDWTVGEAAMQEIQSNSSFEDLSEFSVNIVA